MLNDLFKKKKYATFTITREDLKEEPKAEAKPPIRKEAAEVIDENSTKCRQCGQIIKKEELKKNLYVCPKCDYHHRIGALERLSQLVDTGTFKEYYKELKTLNPLEYEGYEDKISKAQDDSRIREAVLTGEGMIGGSKAAIAIMDSSFIMGSMGSVVGEKITRLVENAMDKKLPLVIFSTSGGARMQEGIISLMQMAKTSAAIKKFSEKGLLYISVLTDPTTGGVTASFAMLGDIILAEPKAQIGFAGKRVIEQTIRQKLPDEFQTSEFLLDHGFVDKIVRRHDLKKTIAKIIRLHSYEG